uniref:Uncharacterized protein n=1 Tax=Panagrolaimus sp. ES5 TaxID=591445 RepID=A0AC34GUT9_9BILA
MAMKSGGDENMIFSSYDTDGDHLPPPAVSDPNSKTGGFEASDNFGEEYGSNEKPTEEKNEQGLRQRRVSTIVGTKEKKDVENKKPKFLDKFKRSIKTKEKLDSTNPILAGLYAYIELIAYFIFIVIILFIALSTNLSDLNDTNQILIKNFVTNPQDDLPAFQDIKEWNQIWRYLENQFFDKIYWSQIPGNNFNGNSAIINGGFEIIGNPRLRMLKVRNDSCGTRFRESPSTECFDLYSKDNEDKATFGPGNSTAFIYTEAKAIGAADYSGRYATYSGGGYIQEIPLVDREAATAILQTLKTYKWINHGTRVVFIDFTVYELNLNLFTIVKLYFEISFSGRVEPNYQIETFKLFRYVDNYVLICEGIFCFYTLFYLAQECGEFLKYGLQYFSDRWNFFDLTIIGISIAAIIVTLKFEFLVQSKIETLAQSKEYIEMEEFVYLSFLKSLIIALLAAFSWIKLLKYIRYNERMTKLIHIVFLAARDILAFFFYFSVIFCGFASFTLLQFGSKNEDFASFGEAFFTMFRLLIGDFDYPALEEASPIMGPLFYMIFVLSIIVFLLNMYLAIINVCYAAYEEDKKSKQKNYVMEEFVIHFYNKLVRTFGFDGYQKKKELNFRFINWMNKLRTMGYTEEEINQSLIAFDIDKDDGHITREEQRLIEISLVKKRSKKYSPNLGNLSTRINAVTAELKHVMEKLDEIEINEFLDNCPAWHDIDKSDL